jgi:hypothetical protein
VSGIGAVTLVYSAATALFRHDIKGLLAYSTISHLGLITLLFGLDTPLSIVAGVFHIINHAIFKASLFMAAGVIDHECGTRDMRRVNGMFKRMPITATLAIIAASSMAGVPLLNGFLSKEMFFAETVGHPQFEAIDWLLPLVATIAGMLAVAYSLRFVHDVFFNGEPVDLPRQPHEPPRWMRAPIELLVLLCLLVGIFPDGPSRRCSTSPPQRRAAGTPAGIRTGAVARLQSALDDEPAGAGRWRFHLRAARSALRLAGTAAATTPAHRLRAHLPAARRRCATPRGGARQRLAAALQRAALQLCPGARRLGLLLGTCGDCPATQFSPLAKPPTSPCSRCCWAAWAARCCIGNACWP